MPPPCEPPHPPPPELCQVLKRCDPSAWAELSRATLLAGLLQRLEPAAPKLGLLAAAEPPEALLPGQDICAWAPLNPAVDCADRVLLAHALWPELVRLPPVEGAAQGWLPAEGREGAVAAAGAAWAVEP